MTSGDFLAKIKLVLEGKDKVVSGLQQTQQAAQQLSKTKVTTMFDKQGLATGKQIEETFTKIGTATKGASTGTGDFERAMRRALVVAPVWMAIRQGIQFVTQGLQEGIQYLVQFETQMFKLQQSLKAIGVTTNLDALREQFVKLSQSTGKSTAEIAKNYTEFIKIHLSVQDAMAATTAATQLQDITFSNNESIIRAVALGYKIYGDTLGKNLTAEQKSTQIAAELYSASQKNLVSIEELSSEFNTFVATGDAVGLTLEQTIGLLATLNSEGVKNITGLRTALFRTFTDTKNIAKEFGLTITPNTKPFEIFIAILERLRTAAKVGNIQLLGQALGEIFGKGGRGGTANVKILSDALDALKKSIGTTFTTESVNNFNEAIKEVDKTLPHQIELWENLKKQTFENFVIGIIGGKDFAGAIQNLNDLMQNQAIPIAKQFGENLKAIGLAVGTLGIGTFYDITTKILQFKADEITRINELMFKGLKGQLHEKEYNNLLDEFQNTQLIKYLSGQERTIKYLQEHKKELINTKTVQEALTTATDKTTVAQNNLTNSLGLTTKERQKDLDKLMSLVFEYEKADMFERGRIRRQIELQAKTPEELVSAYQGTNYDKQIILDNINSFTKEVREALASSIATQRGLTPYTEAITPIVPTIAQQINYSGQMIFYSINSDIIDKLAKKSPEEVIEYILTHPEAKELIANIAANTNTR